MIPESELIIRLVLAVVLGALIGIEREMSDKPAGLRTHILVCLGAALFIVLSAFIAGDATSNARVLAGIVTGIGFLGAGAIIHARDHVHGLTTAADIWVVSAIGIAVGLGYYYAAIVTTVLVLVILWAGRFLLHFKKKQQLPPL